jgi:predicted O-methyltransferase YrrM
MHLPWRNRAYSGGPAISTSITDAEITALMTLATRRSVLEIGSAFGYSAIGMAKLGADVTAVDPHDWLTSHNTMQANIAAYGVEGYVTVHIGRSQQILPQLSGQFELVFIDGDHAAAAVEHDLEWGRKLLTESGVIALHDYTETCCCPDVGRVADAMYGPADAADVVDTLRLIRP